MLPLLRAELTRVLGRRASFWGTIAFTVLILVLAIALAKPDDGGEALNVYATAGSFAALLGVAIMGALSGSYDTANGTMRYLVLTGVSRTRLALVRLLGIMVATLPVALVILVVAVAAASGKSPSPTGTDVANTVWQVVSTVWTWGLVSAAIGMLVRSNGPAIAVSLVLFFGGALINGIISDQVSETFANVLLPMAYSQVSDLSGESSDFAISLPAAFVALAVWVGVLAALAVARVQRDEY